MAATSDVEWATSPASRGAACPGIRHFVAIGDAHGKGGGAPMADAIAFARFIEHQPATPPEVAPKARRRGRSGGRERRYEG